MSTPLLHVAGLTAGYGRIEVVHDLDLIAPAGTVVALLGPSGAGKTTLLRTLSGMLPARRGEVRFDGERIDGLDPDEIARRGLLHVPERGAVFDRLDVRENLALGLEATDGASLDARLPAVLDVFPQLEGLLDRAGGALSGGERQMVAIGRALVAGPRALLLDEFTMGLAPGVVGRLYAPVADLRDAGTAIVIVEQHLDRVLDVADVCYVMASGRVQLVAEPAELRSSDVASRYLGGA